MNELQAEELFCFFEKYAAFLYEMLQHEKEKLSALGSNSLPRIEHAITNAQADAKQMENMEQKRMELQETLGLGGKPFTDVIQSVPPQDTARFTAVLQRIQNYVDEIKFSNGKSMDMARVNLTGLNPDAAAVPPRAENANNPYAKAQLSPQQSILETKI
ncbi:MAG: hypothetical protein PHG02_01490 [Oscillospiraceae bacterium]|nr:hypothetical protein [Oscillospiraceae bacterium]